jgi:AGCS family alanine or glycine:cation symporter
MTILVGLVIIGGLKRIASVAASIVPTMAAIYFIGALSVIFYNYENIFPTFQMIFSKNERIY